MSTPDTAGGPRIVASRTALCQLAKGALLRDSDGAAYRLIGVHPPSALLAETEERPVLATLDLEGYAGTSWKPVFPLFVVWTPDAEPTTTTEETSSHART